MLIAAVPLYRAAMTLAQWEDLIWYAMAYGCFEYWRNDDKPAVGLGELVEEWTPTVVEMLKLAYPEHASAIEVFRAQLVDDMPQFEMNAPAAKSYVRWWKLKALESWLFVLSGYFLWITFRQS